MKEFTGKIVKVIRINCIDAVVDLGFGIRINCMVDLNNVEPLGAPDDETMVRSARMMFENRDCIIRTEDTSRVNMCHGDVFCEYDGEMICINDHLVASGLARRPSDGEQTGEGES